MRKPTRRMFVASLATSAAAVPLTVGAAGPLVNAAATFAVTPPLRALVAYGWTSRRTWTAIYRSG
jgi:hypothetical protein